MAGVFTEPEEPAGWEVLRSEYVHRRPSLTLRRDRVRLANGMVIDDYYVLEYPTWVNVVAITRDDRLVMVKQYRHGIAAANYELPAGTVDPADTDPLAAARRELAEETGFGGGAWSPLLLSSANAATHSNMTHSFLAVGVELVSAAKPELTEQLLPCLVPLSEVRGLVESGRVIQALHLAPLLKYLLSRS